MMLSELFNLVDNSILLLTCLLFLIDIMIWGLIVVYEPGQNNDVNNNSVSVVTV